jgi:hypothetical protein
MTDDIEKRLAKLESNMERLIKMLVLPEEYQEWAGVGVLRLVSDDIEKVRYRANKAYDLAEESGIMAIRFKEELQGCLSDIESRLDDLEAAGDQGDEGKAAKDPEPDPWVPLKLSMEPRERLVKIEDGEIGIYDTQNDKYHYWIELDRINTHRDLLEWVHHLNGKVWVTKEVLDDFIEAVFSYRKWTLYKGV